MGKYVPFLVLFAFAITMSAKPAVSQTPDATMAAVIQPETERTASTGPESFRLNLPTLPSGSYSVEVLQGDSIRRGRLGIVD